MTVRRSRSVKILAFALTLGAVLTACGRDARDEQELRASLSSSEKVSRTFTMTEAAADRWYSIEGAVEDDLRYRLTLSSPTGPIVEMIVMDDALGVRLPRPELFETLKAQLGHPVTADALLTGRWVVDPAAAPDLAPPADDSDNREAPSPIDIAKRLLRVVRAGIGGSSEVREFSLEDIAYRPSLDPWEYPVEEDGEVRYDLLRPILPIREEQVQQGNITIQESHFRKISAFVRDGRVYQVCEMVDVEGHEEFVKLREENIQNEFLEGVMKQVLEGKTVLPVRPRNSFASFSYDEDVEIALPDNALEARLDVFLAGLDQALKGELIAPPGPVPNACLRTEDPAETGSASR